MYPIEVKVVPSTMGSIYLGRGVPKRKYPVDQTERSSHRSPGKPPSRTKRDKRPKGQDQEGRRLTDPICHCYRPKGEKGDDSDRTVRVVQCTEVSAPFGQICIGVLYYCPPQRHTAANTHISRS
jgi:hypothetical protein